MEGLGISGKKAGRHSSMLFTLTSPSRAALLVSLLLTKDSSPKKKKKMVGKSLNQDKMSWLIFFTGFSLY